MLPSIPMVPAIESSECFPRGLEEAGTASAIRQPNFVTRMGRRVFRTRSSSSAARRVALNFEIAISSVPPAPGRRETSLP